MKQQLELHMEQYIGSISGEEYIKGCILSPCLFNLNAEYIIQNAELDEAQAGIKTSGRNKLSLQSHKLGNSIHRKKNQPFYK